MLLTGASASARAAPLNLAVRQHDLAQCRMRKVSKPYQIEESLPGVFALRLEWRPPFLPWYLIDPGCRFVWLVDIGFPFPTGWTTQDLPLFGDERPHTLTAKVSGACQVDLLLPTQQYVNEYAKRISPTTTLIQVQRQPPDYLDPKRIKGPELFRLLNECEWRLMFDVPNDDPGSIWSPDRAILERALSYALWTKEDHGRELELWDHERQGDDAPPFPLLIQE